MTTSRLEAFSDAVLAIIITIMVLELDVPHEPTLHALAESATGLLTYLLSFVYLAIYWNNHHHLFQLVDRARGGVLWANLHLLFWLSVVPFSTAWMDEHFGPTPVMVYGVNLLLAALAYYLLQLTVMHADGPGQRTAAGAWPRPQGQDQPADLPVRHHRLAAVGVDRHRGVRPGRSDLAGPRPTDGALHRRE
jgi:uncharacterized membrane protein